MPWKVHARHESAATPSGRLARDQERALARAARDGDGQARERLIEANLALVVSIAQQFAGRGVPIDDLIGEGNVGLIRAADRFNPEAGTRFGTYATFWIRKEIRLAIRGKAAIIRVPEHLITLLGTCKQAEQTLIRGGNPSPTADQVADALQLSPSQRERVERAHSCRHVRSDAGSTALAGRTPIDHPTIEAMIGDEWRSKLAACIRRLPDQLRAVIRLRFGFDGSSELNRREVAQKLGIKRHRIARIETRALDELALLLARPHQAEADGGRRSGTDSGSRKF